VLEAHTSDRGTHECLTQTWVFDAHTSAWSTHECLTWVNYSTRVINSDSGPGALIDVMCLVYKHTNNGLWQWIGKNTLKTIKRSPGREGLGIVPYVHKVWQTLSTEIQNSINYVSFTVESTTFPQTKNKLAVKADDSGSEDNMAQFGRERESCLEERTRWTNGPSSTSQYCA
jgi:hypothetical protein